MQSPGSSAHGETAALDAPVAQVERLGCVRRRGQVRRGCEDRRDGVAQARLILLGLCWLVYWRGRFDDGGEDVVLAAV